MKNKNPNLRRVEYLVKNKRVRDLMRRFSCGLARMGVY